MRAYVFGGILLMAGCATILESPQQSAKKTFTAAEIAFDTAVVELDGIVSTGVLSPADVKTAHSYVDSGKGFVDKGRAAVVAGDTASAQLDANSLQVLATELVSLLPKKTP